MQLKKNINLGKNNFLLILLILSLFFSVALSIEFMEKAESCIIAIKPIPIITIQTNDSINEIPLLDLAIYFYPTIFTFVFFINFHIYIFAYCYFIHMIKISIVVA